MVRFRFSFNQTIHYRILIRHDAKLFVVDDYLKKFDKFADILNERAEALAIPTYYEDRAGRAVRVRVSGITRQRKGTKTPDRMGS